jgi:hypothetical protein
MTQDIWHQKDAESGSSQIGFTEAYSGGNYTPTFTYRLIGDEPVISVSEEPSHAKEALAQAEELRKKLDSLLDRAEIRQRDATWWYTLAKNWSVPLFVISLLTSLCGVLAGIEPLNGE